MFEARFIKITIFCIFLFGLPLQKPSHSITKAPIKSYHSDNSSSVTLQKDNLPWPHQRPDLSTSEYIELLNTLRIQANYATCCINKDGENYFLHDGLDIELSKGSRLFAIQPGYVKVTNDPNCMTIGDTPEDTPGYGWEYRHTTNFQFKLGDFVEQGAHICDVHDSDHIHLSRVRVSGGGWENFGNREYFHPDGFFVMQDSIAPEIVSPFFYFQNNSDDSFDEGSLPELSGDVDIVVPMRDLSESALNGYSNYSWSVAKIEYEIIGDKIQPVKKVSFDFTEILLNRSSDSQYDQRVLSIYKLPDIPVIQRRGLGDVFLYYIITNMDGRKECCKIFDVYSNYAWETSDLDREGRPLFPDGIYTIVVKAYDSSGNYSAASDTVRVRNRKKAVIRR
jgi:hypothetical protein